MSRHNPFQGAVDLSAIKSQVEAKVAQQAPAPDDMTKTIDVHDSEIIQIEKVLERLKERSASTREYESFDREIRQRFEDIGFVVDVKWFTTNVEGVLSPTIDIVGRTEPKVFDRDRQVHEVTNDLLGLGDGGVIKVDRDMAKALEEGTYKGSGKGGHQH